jgi:two-component system NtrC family response regulator
MKTILIVDDEPNYLIVLTELLQEEGYDVFTAQSGEEGLKIVKEIDLDLVITDMRMPGMDGLALLKEIKFHYKNLPVIMITAFGEKGKALDALQAGANNFLVKPFNNDALSSAIKKLI